MVNVCVCVCVCVCVASSSSSSRICLEDVMNVENLGFLIE
jgi:hypothetical protein